MKILDGIEVWLRAWRGQGMIPSELPVLWSADSLHQPDFHHSWQIESQQAAAPLISSEFAGRTGRLKPDRPDHKCPKRTEPSCLPGITSWLKRYHAVWLFYIIVWCPPPRSCCSCSAASWSWRPATWTPSRWSRCWHYWGSLYSIQAASIEQKYSH